MKPYVCEIYNKSLATKFSLQNQDSCKTCDKAILKKEHLKKHETTHFNPKKHMCVLCQETFSTLTSSDRHKKKHTKEKSISCQNDQVSSTFSPKLKKSRSFEKRNLHNVQFARKHFLLLSL
ncbi:unnamed protein product [Clavelina lepadiformis]|uniref:C2H2-type domain-containing protein n=1 Tax=Clavelina lepadiformis TaxID=159417 RepID=A0ABP0FPG8_CLALP